MKTITFNGRKISPSKVICIGKNYSDHIKEMGGQCNSCEPVIFIKPNSAIAFDADLISIPAALGLLHHEVELVALIDKSLKCATRDEAESAISAYAVGIDFTLRDMQRTAKERGEPWALSKGFDASAALGRFKSANEFSDPCALSIELSVDGAIKQRSNTSEMIYKPAEILSFVSRFMTVEAGDILMCGTPSGVGPVGDGNKIEAMIEGLPALSCVVERN